MIDTEERPIADHIEGIADPAQCESVVGHQTVMQQLYDSYRSGRMHHAWLLNGPRGIGKASLAMVFARLVISNPDWRALPENLDAVAVNERAGRQISQGAHPQLLHLTRPYDGKTRRFKTRLSVDEIRRTQGFYGLTADAGGWRITIVDSVDEMNASASNALLKVLEEPPKRSLFFVLSHSTGRLLPTIRSRCQLLAMQPLADVQVREVLSRLGVQASEKDMQRAVRLGSGSVRTTIRLLQSSVLRDFEKFEKLMAHRSAGSASDWDAAHQVADNLSKRGQEDSFALFGDLVRGWIGAQVRINASAGPTELAGWAELWEKANRSSTLADAFNLDRKQVILSLFGDLFERNGQLMGPGPS